MSFSFLRIILLITLVISLSGFATTAAAIGHNGSIDSCCPRPDGENQGELPCSAPDCPCVICMNAEVADQLVLNQASTTKTAYYTTLQNLFLSAYLATIEYPPEI